MIQHIIITPFSYRGTNFTPLIQSDPLGRKILRQRFLFFEMVTLSCLKAQVNKDFTWIILVDPKLPESYRKKFLTATKDMRNVHLHNFTQEVNQQSLKWLTQYVHSDVQYLIQSTLDADDGVFKGYTQYVRDYYSKQLENNQIQPIQFLSCKNIVQWDFFYSESAPFGYLKPWSRKFTFTVSTGLTLCGKYPEIDFSIKGFGHRMVGLLFEGESVSSELDFAIQQTIKNFSKRVKNVANNSGMNWDGIITKEKHFHQISNPGIHALVLNHFYNKQIFRILENVAHRTRFHYNEEEFVVGLDFPMAEKMIKQSRKPVHLFVTLVWRILFFERYYNKETSMKEAIKRKIFKIRRLRQGFQSMV